SNNSSQVRNVFGITTTVPAGIRINSLLTSIQPPVVLQASGSGGLAGVGAGLSSLLHNPGVASNDAHWICPASRTPAGRVWYVGSWIGAGGTVVGAGQGTGFRLCAAMLAPIATLTIRASRATLNILLIVSKPVILKLLPSSCKLAFLLIAAMGNLFFLCRILAQSNAAVLKLFGERILHPHKVL